MPIFDYKGQDARQLMSEAYSINAYTSAISSSFGLYPILEHLAPNISQTDVLPEGWRELTAAELGVSNSNVDLSGSFKGDGPTIDGWFTAQARVYGKFDANGNLVKTHFSVVGTNNILDVLDYIPMFNNQYIHAFDYLLEALKDYTTDAGLTGSDVVITGYSEGAGVINGMYEEKDSSWGNFYADSFYMGGAAPKIAQRDGLSNDNIFNFGFENDIVHRIGGEADNWVGGLLQALQGNDSQYESTVDNIVLFNDLYAAPLWPYYSWNIANLPGWVAHLQGVFLNPVETIGSSTFYDYIERDSTIILSHLTDLTRPFVWVSDKATATSDHFGTPAFLLGEEKNDKLEDGKSDDFLDGFAGDDKFRLSTGTDTVAGGSGGDEAAVLGNAGDYEAIRLSDGTVYLYDTTGKYGLKALTGIENVVFAGAVHGLFDSSYKVTATKLDGFLWNDVSYSSVQQGTAANNTLIGGSARDRIFGLDGADTLKGGGGNDLVHGGNGNDAVVGEAGNDALYGSAGNDVLNGGGGNDTLSGGVGSDKFIFTDTAFGKDRITDFDIHESGNDAIGFSSAVFATVQAVLNAAIQVGADTVINAGQNSVTLVGFERNQLTASDVFIV